MLRLCKKYNGKFNVDVEERPVEFSYMQDYGLMQWHVLCKESLPHKKFNISVKDDLDDNKIIDHWSSINKKK